jgi:hypothetical protein
MTMVCLSMRWSEGDGTDSHRIGEGLRPVSDALLDPLGVPCGSDRDCGASRVRVEAVGQVRTQVVRPSLAARPLPAELPLWQRRCLAISTI